MSTPRVNDLLASLVEITPPRIHEKRSAEKRTRPKYVARVAPEDDVFLSSPKYKQAHITDASDEDYDGLISNQYGTFIPQSAPTSPTRKQNGACAHITESIPVTSGSV